MPVAALAEPLRFGTLGHIGLEVWWTLTDAGELQHTRLAAALAALRRHGAPESEPFELVRLEELLRGYDARWAGERYEVLGVELEFRAPLINPETGAKSRTFQRAGKVRRAGRRCRGAQADRGAQVFGRRHHARFCLLGRGCAWAGRQRATCAARTTSDVAMPSVCFTMS